ncbi:ATP synthase complex subunit H-domain-containing protein [Lactarius hatsudake]|nr:ATP synthase complex subunit H-domain-containing protein [Lactarius hatsudake]
MSTILKHAASAVRTPFLHTGCFHVIDTNLFLKARLSARSRVRAYATTSAARKGKISPTLCFSRPTLTPLLADLVQDLYLKELRIYKAPPAAKDAHVGAVKAFSVPTTPSAPTLPDLATELAAYDATEPTRADATDVSPVHGGPAAGAEAYLAFLEADEVQEEAHH